MRKLVLVLCGFGILFLVGCADTERQDRRNALTAARQARPNLMERIDGPADAYIYKFETEFSDGTRVGCVTVSSYYNVDCVALTGSDL